jgi:putative ABC transport system permease protein
LIAALLGAARAVRDAVRLAPAVAMAPPAPASYRRLFGEAFYRWLDLPQTAVMVARHLLRWPVRAMTSVLGIAFSVMILVGSLWSFGSVEFMIDVTFHRAERQDATVSFVRERRYFGLADVARLPGVMVAEPYRTVSVKIRNGAAERRVAIVGKPFDARLSRVLDLDLAAVRLPEGGIALSEMLARILAVQVGDLVELDLLEQNRRGVRVPVTEIIQGYLGLTAFMQLDQLNQLVREGAMISGVHIAYDPMERERLFRELKETPIANFVALQRASLQRFRETIAQNIYTMITVYVALALIIAFGVVYNFSRISLSEQAREMASLCVLGFTRGEVSRILLAELAILAVLAQPVGWLFGYTLAYFMVKAFENEIYRVPLILEPNVYAFGSLLVLAAAIVSGLIVRRRVDRLDLVQVLKTRD